MQSVKLRSSDGKVEFEISKLEPLGAILSYRARFFGGNDEFETTGRLPIAPDHLQFCMRLQAGLVKVKRDILDQVPTNEDLYTVVEGFDLFCVANPNLILGADKRFVQFLYQRTPRYSLVLGLVLDVTVIDEFERELELAFAS